MCATMHLGGVPNDILSNLDPIAIIIIVSAAGNKALGNFD
jgi:hypothetical protein